MDLKALIAKLKAAGVNVTALSDDALALVGGILQEVVAPLQAKLTETETALKAVTDKGVALEGKLGELAKTATTASAEPKDKKGKTESDQEEMPGWFKPYAEGLKSLQEETAASKKSATVTNVVKATIEAKFANHPMKSALIEDGIERGLASEAEVLAFVEKANKRLVDSGIIKPEQLTAKPTTEDARKNDPANKPSAEQQVERGRSKIKEELEKSGVKKAS